MIAPRHAALLAVLAALAVSVSACGRKGDLLTPSQAAAEARKEAEDAGKPLPPEPAPAEPNRRFILDPLID